MRLIGLDPGLANTGFGVIETNPSARLIRAGCLTTVTGKPTGARLKLLGEQFDAVVAEFSPDVAVVERVFFGVNAKSAIVTAQAEGVLLLILALHNIPTKSVTPRQIKAAITGQPLASKELVQKCVQEYLKLTTPITPHHAADATAAALSLDRL